MQNVMGQQRLYPAEVIIDNSQGKMLKGTVSTNRSDAFPMANNPSNGNLMTVPQNQVVYQIPVSPAKVAQPQPIYQQ